MTTEVNFSVQFCDILEMIFQFKANKNIIKIICWQSPEYYFFVVNVFFSKCVIHFSIWEVWKPFDFKFSTFCYILPHLTRPDNFRLTGNLSWQKIALHSGQRWDPSTRESLSTVIQKLRHNSPKSARQKLSRMFSAVRCWSQGLLEQVFPKKNHFFITYILCVRNRAIVIQAVISVLSLSI